MVFQPSPPLHPPPLGRDYPRLFQAMNGLLHVLLAGGDERDALRRTFEDAARGFGAEKALLLQVEGESPRRLRSLVARGLTAAEVRACEHGGSVAGVSSSLIRAALETLQPQLLACPPDGPDATPALAGSFSVLCAPVLDPVRAVPLAVMYFQNSAVPAGAAFEPVDAVWLEGYCSALGRAFALYFEERRRERELADLLAGDPRPEHALELIGESAHTQALRRVLHEVYIPAASAPDPEPVLLLGEKGTGKDLIARYLHAYSARREQPFVVVSGAEISDELAAARLFGHKRGAFTGAVQDEPGLLRSAHRGVLFLDEIGELSLRVQATLLRVLESRTVVPVGETREARIDVQVVLATNRDLDEAAAEGLVKPDFLDRFKTQTVHLEPLRERPADIPELARHFLAVHERRTRKRTLGWTPDALRTLLAYAWPGNVRELARLCSAMVTHARLGAPVDRELLVRCYPAVAAGPRNPRAAPVLWADVPMRDAVRELQRELILARLERHGWDVRAARLSLGLPKTTFHRHLAALGIKRPERPPGDEG